MSAQEITLACTKKPLNLSKQLRSKSNLVLVNTLNAQTRARSIKLTVGTTRCLGDLRHRLDLFRIDVRFVITVTKPPVPSLQDSRHFTIGSARQQKLDSRILSIEERIIPVTPNDDCHQSGASSKGHLTLCTDIMLSCCLSTSALQASALQSIYEGQSRVYPVESCPSF